MILKFGGNTLTMDLNCSVNQNRENLLEVVKEIEEGKHIKHLRIDLTGDPARIKLNFKTVHGSRTLFLTIS